jgi:hypothetical protein
MEWVLIFAIHAGYAASPSSLIAVPGFSSTQECETAGKVAKKAIRHAQFTCVAKSKPEAL